MDETLFVCNHFKIGCKKHHIYWKKEVVFKIFMAWNYLFSRERWELAGVPLFLCSIQYNNNNYNSHLCGSKLKLQMEKIPFWCPLNFWSKQQVLRTHFSLSSSATLCVISVKKYYYIVMLLFITNNQASKQSNHHHITWNKTKNNCFKGSQKICLRWIRPVCVCVSPATHPWTFTSSSYKALCFAKGNFRKQVSLLAPSWFLQT